MEDPELEESLDTNQETLLSSKETSSLSPPSTQRSLKFERGKRERRPSIYDDLPVSMASRLYKSEEIIEEQALPNPPVGSSSPPCASSSVVPSPIPVSSTTKLKSKKRTSQGPIFNLFKPIFVRFWPSFPSSETEDGEDLKHIEVGETFGKGRNNEKKEPIKNKPSIYGKVIEEVDPFVFEDTFCVISQKFGKDYVCRYSASRSLFIFNPMNCLRRLCIYIISHQLFDVLIMLTIISNCIAIATDTKYIILDTTTQKYIVEEKELPRELEAFFMIIYSIEMILKIIAKGFVFNHFSYLRNGWNVLDFLVVLLAYFTEIQYHYADESSLNSGKTSDTIQILRTFRVLRAIKTISILPGLRMMINALMNAITQLFEVMLLTFFCLCIFSLFALEIFMGKFHQVCVLIKGSPTSIKLALTNGNSTLMPIDPTHPNAHYEYNEWIHDDQNWLKRSFPDEEFVVCSNDTDGGRGCPEDYVCLPDLAENPDNGWTSFDHFGLSMLSTLQLLTLDYWERLYDLIMSTNGPWCLIFFIGVIFFGSFYLLNLMLAVVAMSYEAEAQTAQQKPLSKYQKLTLHRSHSTFSFEDPFKLDIKLLTTQNQRRTAAERDALAKKIRTASLGRRKKRRAFRRKPPPKFHIGGEGGSGVGSIGGTGVCSPSDCRSEGGSISGSLYGGIDGCEPSPEPPPRKRPNSHKALMSGVLGERPVYASKSKSSSKPKTSPSSQRIVNKVIKSQQHVPPVKPKRIVTIDEGDRVINVIPKRERSSSRGDGSGSIEKGQSIDSGVVVTGDRGTSSAVKIKTRGVRVSARVKSREDDENLEGDFHSSSPIESGNDQHQHDVGLHEAVLNMIGRKMSATPKDQRQRRKNEKMEGLEFQTTSIAPPDHVETPGDIAKKNPGESSQAFVKESKISSTSFLTTVQHDESRPSRWRKLPASDFCQQNEKTGDTKQVLNRMNKRLNTFVTHWLFESFITTCIIINTILLASEHHGQPHWLTDAISIGSHCFTAVFTLECILKLIALQRDYFSQPWNLFDLAMVVISFTDIILDFVSPDNGFAFRVFRLLRIFKLAQSWITMKVLLNIIFSTFGALGNLTLVLAIFIYIFAILGMQLLGDGFLPESFDLEHPDDIDYPRWHYQDFWHAFMMIFRVIAQEWIEPLAECLDAHDGAGEWRCFMIYIPVLVFGTFIVLNLFLALLLNSFNSEELKAQREKEKELAGKADTLKSIVGMLIQKNRKGLVAFPAIVAAAKEQAQEAQALPQLTKSSQQNVQSSRPRNDPEAQARQKILRMKFIIAAHKIIMLNRKAAAIRAIQRAEEGLSENQKTKFLSETNSLTQSLLGDGNMENADKSSIHSEEVQLASCLPDFILRQPCLLCTCIREAPCVKWTHFRRFCLRIVSNNVFEWTILVLILGSSITLCFEDVHLETKPTLKLTLFILNTVFTIIFLLEMFLKWFALGLVKYFTEFWTILDFFIILVSVVSLGFDIDSQNWEPLGTKQRLSAVASLKALRTLRALRPLRAISRWQGMKVVVNALMYAIPSIFNVLLVCLLFWLVFAIMGVQFFKGKFYKCIHGESGRQMSSREVPDRTTCCEKRSDTVWINTTPNFDNVFEAYLSLFQVATFEGWMELMTAASDITAEDTQPKRDSFYVSNIYFVVFIIFGTFFTLNLFIGVIIDNFNMLKKKYEGNLVEALLTPSQMRYYTAMKKLGRKKPQRVIRRPLNKFLALFYDISMSRRFEIAIFVLIFLNMLVMAFEHYGQRNIFHHILTGFNSFFSTIYALEAIVKIIGMRQYYFSVPWNLFDFSLVVFSILDLFLTDVQWSLPFPPTMLRVVRVFRIGRVLRLIKAAKGIRKLLFALIVSLPALFNIGALLALITFIYAILGMALFKDANYYGTMDEIFNFKTFPRSCMILLRLMTAAGWNDVLSALVVEEPECNVDSYRKLSCGKEDEPECVSRMVATAYMVSYIIITCLIIINMYIAIILENFVEANQDEEIGIVEDDLEMFYIRWSRYDPTATQFIAFDQLSEFLASLDPPLDIPRPNIVAIVSFNLPIARGNKIHCLDILHALVKHVLGHVDDSEEFRKIQEQMEAKFRKQFPSRKLLDIVSSTRIWKIQHNAAVIIQRAWREYKEKKYASMAATQQSTQTVGTTRVTQHSFGHKLGQFFHVGGDKRRRSSLREGFSISRGGRGSPLPMIKDGEQYTMKSRVSGGRNELGELPSAYPRSSYSSQSSSSASPLPVPKIQTQEIPEEPMFVRTHPRRLSPSRLSGGSFDVAVNFGSESVVERAPINTQLLGLHLPKSIAVPKKSSNENIADPKVTISENETNVVNNVEDNTVQSQSKFNYPGCISYSNSPTCSGPSSPISTVDKLDHDKSDTGTVTVEIHGIPVNELVS